MALGAAVTRDDVDRRQVRRNDRDGEDLETAESLPAISWATAKPSSTVGSAAWKRATGARASATPPMVGVVSVVMLSPATPLSLPGVTPRMSGAAASTVSIRCHRS
jgi:hypothetical protein